MGGRKSMHALLLAVVAACALGAPGVAAASELEVVRRPELGMTLLRPGWRWTLLGRTEASQLLPNAVMGAIGPAGQSVLVLVDAEPGIDLETFARVQLTSAPRSTAGGDPLATVTYAGRPAVRLRIAYPQGAVWMDEEDLYFRHAGQLVHIHARVPRAPRPSWAGGSGPGLPTDLDAAFAAFHAALSLEAVAEAVPPVHPPAWDQRGVGWRVMGGVFEHAVAGLRLPIDPAWSVLPTAAAQRVDEDAELVLVHRETGAVLVWLYDMDVGLAEAGHRDAVHRQLLQANPGSRVGPDREAILLGDPLAFVSCLPGGAWPREISCAARRLGPQVVVLRVLAPAQAIAPAWEALAALLAAAERIEESAGRQLAEALAAEPDPDDRIDPRACIRNGVWSHVPQGLRWTKPSSSWRLRTVSALESLLAIRDLATGVVARLHAIEPPARGPLGTYTPTPIEWHRTVVARAAVEGRTVRSAMPLRMAGQEALFSSWQVEFAPGGDLVVVLGTLPWRDGCLVLHVVGPVAGGEAADEAMAALVGAFEAWEAGSEEREVSARRIADPRLGIAFTAPGDDWIVRDETPAALAARGGLLHALGPQQDAVVAVLFAEGSAAVAREALVPEIRRTLGSLFLSAHELAPRAGKLLGLEATCHAWRLGEARADLWLARSGELLYALCVTTRPDGSGVTIDDVAPLLERVR